MVGGKSRALLCHTRSDHPCHDIHRRAIKVRPCAVDACVEGLWGDACVGDAAQQAREEVCGVDLAAVPAARRRQILTWRF